MSKNTSIADLINYISVDGSGNVVLTTGGQVATQSYVTTAVSNLVNAAPSTLDTLNELAAALGNDANFATTVTTSIATRLPLAGGTLTGNLNGTSALFTGNLRTDTGFGLKYGSFVSTSGYLNLFSALAGSTMTLNLKDGSGGFESALTFTNTANRNYTFPNANGTIALTDNLSSYLPLSGGNISGNLTIGNPSSALAQLHVYNASAAASFLLQTNSSTAYSEIAVRNFNQTSTSYFRQYSSSATGTDFGVSRVNLAAFFSNYAGNFAIGTQNGGDLIFGTANTEAMRITTSRNLTFNTTNVPSGIVQEVGGETPLLGLDVNFRPSNLVNTVYAGAQIRIDMRSGQPAFSFLYRQAGSTGDSVFMKMTTSGNFILGNFSDIGTKLQVNGVNYIEMATFACTTASASDIVSNNSGIVQFSLGNARHCSNTDLFVPVSNGIQITKAGIVHVSFSQDITTAGTTGYVAGYIRKNGTNISENLITNTDSQWDGINGVATINVNASDVIGFSFNAAEIISFDPNTWSNYSFIWSAR
jgi:hypothetical protein